MAAKKEKVPLSNGVVRHKKERGFCPAPAKASVRGCMMSDVIQAAIKNIELHVTTHGDDDNELLTEWAIPQLRSVLDRLLK